MDNRIEKKRNVLEEKIRIYKKNNKTLCDLVTFYISIDKAKNNNNVAQYMLFDELVRALEDPEIDLALKEDSLEILFEKDKLRFNEIYKEIEENDFEDLKEKLKFDYRKKLIESEANRKKMMNLEFNFAAKMIQESYELTCELLYSDINVNKKCQMLYEIIIYIAKNSYFFIFKHLFDPTKKITDLERTPSSKIKEKIEEIKSQFSKIDYATLLLEKIMGEKEDIDWICYLQKEGLANFMKLSDKEKLKGVSVCSCFDHKALKNFRVFYELKDYLEVPEQCRENDDKIIIKHLAINEFSQFIALSHFKITEAKVKEIAKRVFDYQYEHDIVLESNIKESIKFAILHKAKNKEEYKTMCEYVELFTELSNYQSYKKELEKQQLNNARLNLLIRLNNMGKSLEKQVPEETMIRSLDFYKKISK